MRIRVDIDKLKHYLRDQFEMSFSSTRSWDDLPDYIQQHWTEVANELAEDLVTQNIVEIIP